MTENSWRGGAQPNRCFCQRGEPAGQGPTYKSQEMSHEKNKDCSHLMKTQQGRTKTVLTGWRQTLPSSPPSSKAVVFSLAAHENHLGGCYFSFLNLFIFGCATQLVGSWFLNQGHGSEWPPGNPLSGSFIDTCMPRNPLARETGCLRETPGDGCPASSKVILTRSPQSFSDVSVATTCLTGAGSRHDLVYSLFSQG